MEGLNCLRLHLYYAHIIPIGQPDHFDRTADYTHTVPMSEKKLFKLWAEKKQLDRFKALSKRKKLSVAWLMRQAFDEFLKKQRG
jgi:Ribbon-helix-helix protein, copG family